MGYTPQGNSGVASEVDGINFRAQRFTQRPMDYDKAGGAGVVGHYELELTTGGYGALAAGTTLFSMRWTDATRFCVIRSVRASVQTTSPFTTSQLTSRELVVARSWTVSDTGGGAVVLTGNALKLKTAMPSTLFATGDIRFHSGAITPGTRTVEANVIGQALGWSQGGIDPLLGMDINRADLMIADSGDHHPIVLAANEGIIVQVGTLMGAGGVQKTTVKVNWAEVLTF